MDARLQGCRAFGELSRAVVERRLEQAAEEGGPGCWADYAGDACRDNPCGHSRLSRNGLFQLDSSFRWNDGEDNRHSLIMPLTIAT